MKVTMLVENATPSDRFCARHGLSMLLERGEGASPRRILFDVGPDASFLGNARAMGAVALGVDAAVVSHGHFDHGGGLRAFLEATEELGCDVPVYVHARAFEEHLARTPAGLKNIGLDASLPAEFLGRIRLSADGERLSEGVVLVSDVPDCAPAPASNRVLLERSGGGPDGLAPDAFAHEQSLLVRDGGGWVLVSGCSHCGIVNIVRRAEEVAGGPLRAVVAGLHLMNPATGEVEDPRAVAEVAAFLSEHVETCYTFHCTGLAAYGMLRDALGDRVSYLCTGSAVEV